MVFPPIVGVPASALTTRPRFSGVRTGMKASQLQAPASWVTNTTPVPNSRKRALSPNALVCAAKANTSDGLSSPPRAAQGPHLQTLELGGSVI